jgi:NitT/TauT family transport system permease protein/sulfonate transport system permease protein
MLAHVRGVLGIGVPLVLWEIAADFEWVNSALMPSPTRIAAAMWEMGVEGTLWSHLGASLQRVFLGFLLAAIVGITIGVITAWLKAMDELVKPVIEALRPIPPIAWTPLAILWFGVGNAPSYFLVFIGAVFPILVNTYSAVRNIDQNQINAALCLGAKPGLILRDVLIPASLPVIFPGLRVGLGVGWMCVVAAELIAAQSGLGYMIQQSRMLLQTQNVLAGMVTIGMVGYAMSMAMERLERRLVRWSAANRA